MITLTLKIKHLKKLLVQLEKNTGVRQDNVLHACVKRWQTLIKKENLEHAIMEVPCTYKELMDDVGDPCCSGCEE